MASCKLLMLWHSSKVRAFATSTSPQNQSSSLVVATGNLTHSLLPPVSLLPRTMIQTPHSTPSISTILSISTKFSNQAIQSHLQPLLRIWTLPPQNMSQRITTHFPQIYFPLPASTTCCETIATRKKMPHRTKIAHSPPNTLTIENSSRPTTVFMPTRMLSTTSQTLLPHKTTMSLQSHSFPTNNPSFFKNACHRTLLLAQTLRTFSMIFLYLERT
mmetsp:Transcript_3464/g.13223  ORF Transcript_3464/g.13223 Transcript_3464/m.13223 type:complete len:216 (-) Transcript_3464:1805-2452(-)